MGVGTIVGIAVVLFVVGNIMALKPGGVDVRLDKLRTCARRLELHPKLVACPDWVRGKNGEYGKGMIAQYALVLDSATYKLAQTHYQVIDGELRPANAALLNADNNDINSVLDHEPLQLPEAIGNQVKAIYSKANSVVIFWHDVNYVKPASNPNYNAQQIEADLLILKQRLADWADKLS